MTEPSAVPAVYTARFDHVNCQSYVQLHQDGGPSVRRAEVGHGLFLDYDADGVLVGIQHSWTG